MSQTQIKNLLEKYNLAGSSYIQLDGYGSINYKVNSPGQNYILKYYSEENEYQLIAAENRMLEHLAELTSLNLPKVKGELKLIRDQGFVRLLSYVDGSLLTPEHFNASFITSLGKSIAELDVMLAEVNELAIRARKSTWDLQHALINEVKLVYIKNPTQVKLVMHFLDRFKVTVMPKLNELRQQVIHGDLNENNIIINNSRELEGFIDFGDVCHGPLINELAIAATYIILLEPKNYLSNLTKLVTGYHSIIALQTEEIALLYDLIATRMCISVLHSAEAKSKHGATDYILQNEESAWYMLNNWSEISNEFITQHLLEALGLKRKVVSSDQLLRRRYKVASPSLSLSYSTPLHMESSLFQFMFDAEGNRYLDAYNNIPHVGHCHPKVIEAISNQIRKLNTNTRYLYNIYADYSEHLLSYFHASLTKLLLVNSGSAASDLAIRIAKTVTGRKHIAVLDHGYHGNTMLAIEASAYKFNGKGGNGAGSHVIKLPLPKEFNGRLLNGKAYADEAINILTAEISKGRIPGIFLAEPVSGCGGQVPLASGYLEHLIPFLKKHGILYASDEVQTGFGRIGSHFWGYELHNVIPDLVILGKPMGNGHPMGGVVTTTELSDGFSNGMEFFSSFGGNPVSCAAGKSVLNVIEDEKLQTNALEVGSYWLRELFALQRKFPLMADIRGHGIFIGIEFSDSDNTPLTEIAGKIKNGLKERFILTSTDGPFDNVLKMKPPLCFSKANVNEFTQALESVLSELSQL